MGRNVNEAEVSYVSSAEDDHYTFNSQKQELKKAKQIKEAKK